VGERRAWLPSVAPIRAERSGGEMERAGAIALYSFGPEGGGEDLDLGGKELVESWLCRLKWMA
jgi:hypothetical protein